MKIRSGKYNFAWSFEDDAGNTAKVPELLCIALMRLGAMAQREVGVKYDVLGTIWLDPDFLAVLKRESEK